MYNGLTVMLVTVCCNALTCSFDCVGNCHITFGGDYGSGEQWATIWQRVIAVVQSGTGRAAL